MSSFLSNEQRELAEEIASRLTERGETVAVAESTAGGLISAALLSVAGASRYYSGGGVLYTLNSRTALAGVPAEEYADYRGTTPTATATREAAAPSATPIPGASPSATPTPDASPSATPTPDASPSATPTPGGAPSEPARRRSSRSPQGR